MPAGLFVKRPAGDGGLQPPGIAGLAELPPARKGLDVHVWKTSTPGWNEGDYNQSYLHPSLLT
jgi:hypothetical protein